MKPTTKPPASGDMFRDTVDEQRIAHTWQRIRVKRRRRSVLTVRHPVLSGATALLAAAGLAALLRISHRTPPPPAPLSFNTAASTHLFTAPRSGAEEKRIPFSDGSTITLATGATLEVRENTPKRFLTSLRNGWVRYNVIPNRSRIWELDAGLCRIVVLGTQFTVSRTDRAVRIAVHRGTVSVYSTPDGEPLVTLTAGQRHTELAPTTKPPRPAPAPESSPRAISAETGRPRKPTPSRPRRGRTTKSRMSEPLLAGLGASHAVNDLLRQADTARQNMRPERAATLLGRILKAHPEDPAVGLVALTLGNLRLDTLHAPRAAARAFERAAASRKLPRPLREQAFARCVEAYHRSGDRDSARAVADEYRQRYPNGTWLPVIERWAAPE